jgi:hypothetical protein
MVARPCLNIVWSSASKTLIFLAVSSGALSIPYHYPSATARVGQYSASASHRVSAYPYSPECVEGEFSELPMWGVSEVVPSLQLSLQ